MILFISGFAMVINILTIQNNTDTTSVNHGLYRAMISITASTSDGNSESFDVMGNTVLYWL